MIISKLNKEDYTGKKFIARYKIKGYYDIQRISTGFEFTYTQFIGFDLYSYSNDDPEKYEIRIEMGRIV